MIKVIKYTKIDNSESTMQSIYTSQAHREFNEKVFPWLTSGYVADDISADYIREVKISNRENRISKHTPRLIAEIAQMNEDAFAAETLTVEQYPALKAKLAPIKEHLSDSAFEFAVAALTSLDLPEYAPEVKAAFIAKIQSVLDKEIADLNPEDNFPQVGEESEEGEDEEENP